MDYFGYGEQDFIPCEYGCGKCVDVHHIHGRGPGKDIIENLMGLCREKHNQCGSGIITKKMAQEQHDRFINNFKGEGK